MKLFIKKNKHKEVVILDIPLLLENRINHKEDFLIFIQSKKLEIMKRLKKRENFNNKLLKNLKTFNFHLIIKKIKLILLLIMILLKKI